jgi:hypothetical protein
MEDWNGAVITLIKFGFALVAILVAAALFTDAVEILGERLNLAQGAVGPRRYLFFTFRRRLCDSRHSYPRRLETSDR